VHVLGHEHESGEPHFKFFAGRVNAASQLPTPGVIREKWLALVARKRQLVQITRFVIMLDELSMGSSRTHARQLRLLERLIQAAASLRTQEALAKPVAPSEEALAKPVAPQAPADSSAAAFGITPCQPPFLARCLHPGQIPSSAICDTNFGGRLSVLIPSPSLLAPRANFSSSFWPPISLG
jgi:hypothetical protein